MGAGPCSRGDYPIILIGVFCGLPHVEMLGITFELCETHGSYFVLSIPRRHQQDAQLCGFGVIFYHMVLLTWIVEPTVADAVAWNG